MQNDRIIIDQKLRIAETKLKEYEERNQNINRMNGTIMNVLNDLNSNQQNVLSPMYIHRVSRHQNTRNL